MATIHWRGTSAVLNWSEGHRQIRRSLGAVTEYEAEAARSAKEAELRGDKVFTPSELFGVAAVRYLEWHRIQFPDSHARTSFVVEHRLTRFHHRPLAAITQLEIEQWISERSQDEVRCGTVEKELRTLKALLNKAVQWKLLEESPAEYARAPRDVTSAPPHWYTAAQLQTLYELDPDHAPTWQFLANTGLRRREAMHLRWEDIRDGCVWIISRDGARTKSAKWRQVPLSAGAVGVLPRLRQGNKSIYVLPRLAKESWSRAFSKAASRARIGGNLHSLRHTFAANLVAVGVNLRVVQRLMGHATIKTTEQYAHVSEETLQAAVGLLKL